MGKIITFLGVDGVGCTTTSLMFSKMISEIIDKNTLLIDFNYKRPDIYKILSGNYDDEPRFNLDMVMNYAICEKDLKSIFETNIDKMNNSKLEILMGSNVKVGFENEQYINFLNQVEKLYDFTIIDTFIDKVPDEILDYSSKIFLVVDQNKNNLIHIQKKYWKLIARENVEVIVNKYEKGIFELSDISKILEKKISYKLNHEKRIIKAMNNATISIDQCTYTDIMYKLCKDTLKKFNYKLKNKSSLLSLFKVKKRGELNNVEVR